MSYLDKLRKQSKENYEKLKDDVQTSSGEKHQGDDRFWKLTVDAAGNGSAIFRFLPPLEGEASSFVKKFSYGFKGENGRWFFENCPTTIGKPCPLCEWRGKIWKDNSEEEARRIIGKKTRGLSYISNIYIISDPGKKENEGKVFLFSYGQKIFDKIKAVIEPQYEDEISFDPFNLWEGANFKLRAKIKNEYRTYEDSVFDKTSEFLKGDEEKIEEVLKSMYSLQALVDSKQFKDYSELEDAFKKVMDSSSKPKPKTIEDKIEQDTPTDSSLNDLPFDNSKSDDLDIDDLLKDL